MIIHVMKIKGMKKFEKTAKFQHFIRLAYMPCYYGVELNSSIKKAISLFGHGFLHRKSPHPEG
ncbi:hypothetical protein HMPREF1863_00883 [Aedoeadaptatus coxii]|uniref:Uncharacterized protein n=1 Tax=Aedoeadaptatus coxii TaxID=755172 RepID=A0A134AGL2_9FIRM|nr:hypothetical protein HMPREF1863_00883 [Peptoniphilus coxii]